MKYRKQILFLILIFICIQVSAQDVEEVDPMPITLKGKVLNLDDETPVSSASVLNYRTHSTVITDEQGRFTMEMLNIDSLAISSIGYSKTTARVPANYNEMNVLILYAKPIRYAIPEVNVSGKKLKVEGLPTGKKIAIDPQLRGDAYNKKPPIIAVLVNPLSFAQYYLSKSEREKRETRKAIITEKQWNTISEYYNKKLVMEVTGVNEPQAELLMLYINNKDLFSQMRSDYDVRNIIKVEYENYKNDAIELQKEKEKEKEKENK
ncbi:MAG: hypothetical protein WCI54_03630 [Bacteroidia bacterium]